MLQLIGPNQMFQLKTEHILEVKRLKEELITVTSSYEKQSKLNIDLQAKIKFLVQAAENLQKSNIELSDKLKTLESEKKELENSFEESNELNMEQMHKSTETFVKLQEAIKVADDALEEVNNLLGEKRQMEDECNNLAQTIGSVMELASERIEKDVADLKVKHLHEMENSHAEIDRLKQILECEKAKVKIF